ncbi:MAG: hypothetical protein ACI4U3_07800 [Traorella sp.]
MNKEVYERLVKECNRQSEMLNSDGQGINLVEFKYLNNCLDCMEYMDNCYSIDLDCSEISLEVMDIMFENAHEAYLENELEHVDLFIEMFSGYVGMVYKNILGGNFVYDENNEALNVNTNHIYVNEDIKACIFEGKKVSEQFKVYKEVLA